MPARIRKQHQDDIRQKIRGSVIVHGLQRFFLKGEFHDGKSWRQATAADAPILRLRMQSGVALLNKIVPDMHEHTGKDGGPLEVADVTDTHDPLAVGRRVAFVLAQAAIRKAKSPDAPAAPPMTPTTTGEL